MPSANNKTFVVNNIALGDAQKCYTRCDAQARWKKTGICRSTKKDALRKRAKKQCPSVKDKTKDATRKRAKRQSASVEDKTKDATRKRAKRQSSSVEDKTKDATRKREKRQRIEMECNTSTAEVSSTSKDAKEYAEALSEQGPESGPETCLTGLEVKQFGSLSLPTTLCSRCLSRREGDCFWPVGLDRF